MSGFYVTLPSNSSMNHYPGNTKSSFRTQLAETINLNEEHEVALVEINYSSNIQTYLGDVIIYDYYKYIFLGYNSIVKIPININRNVSSSRLLNIISTTIEKVLLYDFYNYLHKLTNEKISDEILKKYVERRNNEHLSKDYYIEVFLNTRKNSKYILIDSKNAFIEKILKTANVTANFNNLLNRWELDSLSILHLSHVVPIRVILVKYDILNSNEKIDEMNKIHEYIQIDRLSAINQVKFQDEFMLNFVKSEIKNEFDVKHVDYFTLKNGKVTNSDSFTFPFLKEFKSINNQTISLKLETTNSTSRFEITGQLAYLLGSEINKLVISPTKIYFMPFEVNTINYALIYTDIIKEQYFGDKLTNVLKMIPLKSSSDNEVVTFFDNLHYVPLSMSNFSSINIEIRDIYGNLIKFDDIFTYVILKLHFKKL